MAHVPPLSMLRELLAIDPDDPADLATLRELLARREARAAARRPRMGGRARPTYG